jgi:hypothetical protein
MTAIAVASLWHLVRESLVSGQGSSTCADGHAACAHGQPHFSPPS